MLVKFCANKNVQGLRILFFLYFQKVTPKRTLTVHTETIGLISVAMKRLAKKSNSLLMPKACYRYQIERWWLKLSARAVNQQALHCQRFT